MSSDSLMFGVDDFSVSFVTRTTPFSNWSSHQIRIWNKTFPTVEHAYQYKKFADHDIAWADRIRRAKSPLEAKKLSRMHRIDSKSWDKVRVEVMTQLIRAKCMQHAEVKKALLETGEKTIIERGNEDDGFWGSGEAYNGVNQLGKIWMLIRNELRTQRIVSTKSLH